MGIIRSIKRRCELWEIMIITTNRLIPRPWEESDADSLYYVPDQRRLEDEAEVIS